MKRYSKDLGTFFGSHGGRPKDCLISDKIVAFCRNWPIPNICGSLIDAALLLKKAIGILCKVIVDYGKDFFRNVLMCCLIH